MARINSHRFITLLAALVAAVAHAQPPASATVRVKIQGNAAVIGDTGVTILGELVRRDSSGLVVHRFDPPISIRIDIATIERAEYLRVTGRDGGRMLKTAVLIGAGVGAIAGYVAGSQAKYDDCTAYCSPGFSAGLGGAAGALLGLVVGIPVAATGDRWERFEPADVRVSAAALPAGRGVVLALRWTP